MTDATSDARRVALHTLGCRLNQSETNILTQKFQRDGYEVVPFTEAADVGVINTCTVTNEADAKSRKMVRAFIRRNPEAYVAVIGCYAQMDPETLREIEGVDLVVGNQEKLNILDYVNAGKNDQPLVVRDQILNDSFSINFETLTQNTRRANLKVQDGCDFMCSFCVIPFARGRARSRDLDNLLEEAQALVTGGAKEIVLTGVNIGTYEEQEFRLGEVVDRLNTIDGLLRIRISSIEPTTIQESLLDRMNSPDHALVPHLHIPLQSGSNKILESMRRKYTREEFITFVDTAASKVPNLCIGTDVMVGAPGETEADFEQTSAVLTQSPLAYAHVFQYSEREGTAAMRIPEHIDPPTKARRGALVRKISAGLTRQFHEAYAGGTETVLFETQANGYWSGYTANYIRVAVQSDAILTNQVRPVVLEESAGEFMTGRCLEDALTGAAK